MKRVRRPFRLQLHPELAFWGCFLALNALLFLPFYLLNRQEAPIEAIAPAVSSLQGTLTNLLLWREAADPFRINIELVLLLALWVNVAWLRRGVIRWIMMAAYCITLLYYLYESIMVYLYRVEPVFYNHYFLVRDGLRFLMENLNLSPWVYLAAVGGLTITIGVVIKLTAALINNHLPTRLSRATRLALTALAAAALLSVATYRSVSADPRMVVSSLTFKLEKNISASINLYQSILNFNDAEIHAAYNYGRHRLTQRPNIYLIFVESYGSVLYKRPDWQTAYVSMLEAMQAKLTDGGFSVAHALSESPTWGGGSWLAYTSALFGLRMENHPQYLTLMERYQSQLPRYPDLGTYLRNQGYYFLWMTSIADELGDGQWNRYRRFYGVNDWIRYRDLEFVGPRYGWGPAPPDQYVLGYARDQLMADLDQPHFIFYITQNSHYPWDPMPSVVEDWRDLNTPSPEGDPQQTEVEDHPQRRARYLSAIDYSLDMLTRFVLDHQDENAVFILIGDHQPPRVSRREDGYETPIHIVSRDPAFIANLSQFGFTTDIIRTATPPQLRHEALYSMLVRTLVQTYGVRPQDAPAYLPNGVTVPDWISSVEAPSTK